MKTRIILTMIIRNREYDIFNFMVNDFLQNKGNIII